MARKYQVLFTIQWIHNLYPNGLSRDFLLVPTAEGRKQLANYGMLFKPLETGGLVAVEMMEQGAGTWIPVRPITEAMVITLLLKVQKANVLSKTRPFHAPNLPLLGKTRTLYLTNLNATNTIDTTEILAKSALGVDIADIASIVSEKFVFRADPAQINQVAATAVFPGSTFSKTLNLDNDHRIVEFDLPFGAYNIKRSGLINPPDEVVFADQVLMGEDAVGIVQIFKNQSVDYNNPKHYRIPFRIP